MTRFLWTHPLFEDYNLLVFRCGEMPAIKTLAAFSANGVSNRPARRASITSRRIYGSNGRAMSRLTGLAAAC